MVNSIVFARDKLFNIYTTYFSCFMTNYEKKKFKTQFKIPFFLLVGLFIFVVSEVRVLSFETVLLNF